MTQRDLQPLISDAMDEGDMRQETRDLVHLGGGRRWNAVPTAAPHGRAAVPSAVAQERAPPAWGLIAGGAQFTATTARLAIDNLPNTVRRAVGVGAEWRKAVSSKGGFLSHNEGIFEPQRGEL